MFKENRKKFARGKEDRKLLHPQICQCPCRLELGQMQRDRRNRTKSNGQRVSTQSQGRVRRARRIGIYNQTLLVFFVFFCAHHCEHLYNLDLYSALLWPVLCLRKLTHIEVITHWSLADYMLGLVSEATIKDWRAWRERKKDGVCLPQTLPALANISESC